MQAMRVNRIGGPEVLSWETVPTPQPGKGQVLIKCEAVGVNFVEIYHRTGLYKTEPPFTPGGEAAGVVEAVGPEVTETRIGARVVSADVSGAYAEYALIPSARAVVVPDDVAPRVAAAAMLQGMTAHYLACATYPLHPGDACLVHAAAGGVGLLLCQIARRRGARVIGTVSTEEKAALARQAGAADVILYTRQDVVQEVRRLTGGAGVQVVYDSVGESTFQGSLNSLAPRGTLVLYGQSSGPVAPFNPQVLSQKGSLFLTRPKLADYTRTREELLARSGEVFDWIRQGSLKVRIGLELPLKEAAEAHRKLGARETTGKILLIP